MSALQCPRFAMRFFAPVGVRRSQTGSKREVRPPVAPRSPLPPAACGSASFMMSSMVSASPIALSSRKASVPRGISFDGCLFCGADDKIFAASASTRAL